MTHILKFGNAKPRPSGGKLGVLLRHAAEERVSAIKVRFRTGANHERTEQRAGLQVLFADRTRERAVASGRTRRVLPLGAAKTVKRGENLVRDFRLHGDEIKRSNADRATGTDTLRTDVEQLPIE